MDDLSPLSQALIQSIDLPPAYANVPSGSFVIITSAICFKPFETRFLAGLGEANLSRTLEQIRETSVFRNLTSIVWDNSDTIPLDIKKKEFFLGNRINLKLMLEYCILSKVELEESGEVLDESDLMILGDFNCILELYTRDKTIKICDDHSMMEIFRFFVRDRMFEATLLAERISSKFSRGKR